MQEEDGGDVCLAGDGASGTQVQAQAQARTLGGRWQLISRQGVRASGRQGAGEGLPIAARGLRDFGRQQAGRPEGDRAPLVKTGE